jgi:hypothetical protein
LSRRTYVDNSVLKDNDTNTVDVDCALDCSLSLWVRSVFELPTLSTFVELEAWIVVAFVKVLKNTGENFWFVVRQIDTLCCFEKLVAAE